MTNSKDDQGHKDKYRDLCRKILSEEMPTCNMKTLKTYNLEVTLALTKVFSKVKVFKKWIKLQGQGYRVKNIGTHGKVLSQGILI